MQAHFDVRFISSNISVHFVPFGLQANTFHNKDSTHITYSILLYCFTVFILELLRYSSIHVATLSIFSTFLPAPSYRSPLNVPASLFAVLFENPCNEAVVDFSSSAALHWVDGKGRTALNNASLKSSTPMWSFPSCPGLRPFKPLV